MTADEVFDSHPRWSLAYVLWQLERHDIPAEDFHEAFGLHLGYDGALVLQWMGY